MDQKPTLTEVSKEESQSAVYNRVSDMKSRSETTHTATSIDQNKKDDKGVVQVGRNFLETFAFIEDTKFYEEPAKVVPRTTSSSTAAV